MSDHTDSSMIDPRDTIAVEAQRAIERARGWVQRWVSAGKAPAPAVERALADLLTEAEQRGHERGAREEREACAEWCRSQADMDGAGGSYSLGWRDAAEYCADGLRTRTEGGQDE